jgi:hypothetical protein
MDDFEIFVGQEFLRMVQEEPIPHLDSLVIFIDQKQLVIQMVRGILEQSLGLVP